MTVLNMREPAGEAQTLDPRPRPEIWVLAVAVKPVGRVQRMELFLLIEGNQSFVNVILFPFIHVTVLVDLWRTYFSRIVDVLVTTSPYSRY
jgi:hypothetical protein